jgi:hypothetical protein
LAAKFATDAAAGARDGYDATAEHLTDVVGTELDAVAAEEVLDFDFAELADSDLAEGELVERGDSSDGKLGFSEEADEFADASCRGGRHSDDGFLDVELRFEFEELFGWAYDGDVVDA